MSPPANQASGFRLQAAAGSRQPAANSERGIALLIVVSLLTVIGIMGVAFAFSMYLETQASRQFAATTQARYVAEAGIHHARALLDEDRLGSRADDPTEGWEREFAGSDVDVNGDGMPDARWWPLEDAAEQPAGRYAVQIRDEGGKANLNAGYADPPTTGVGALNLTTLFERVGMNQPAELAQTVEQYRNGPDTQPGAAGIDDDKDGAIDEVDEFQPLALQGDDRRIERLEDLIESARLDAKALDRLKQVATVYSRDLNISVTGKPRINVNTAGAEELLGVLLEAGVADPWQAAANMADYVDPDLELTRLLRSSQLLMMPNQGPQGQWQWADQPEGHYESHEPDAGKLSWIVQVPTGTFRILARGISGLKVGDVTVAGQHMASVDDGASLGVFELANTLTIEVLHREPAGTVCAFRGIELVDESATTGQPVRGIEAVRINELMVRPTMAFEVTSATFSNPLSSGWGQTSGASYYQNGGVGKATWTWTSALLPPGNYYLRVFGRKTDDAVGLMESDQPVLRHGQYASVPVTVTQAIQGGQDVGKFSITIDKTSANEPYYLQSVELTREPDGEYLELINLSDRPLDVGGWSLEGEAMVGRQAQLPPGAVIQPHGLLVAAVDLDDADSEPAGVLSGNGLDARSAWQIPPGTNAVQLRFPGGSPSPGDDWLKTTLPGQMARVVLRTTSGLLVDEVVYPVPLPSGAAFQSLEKGDPSVVTDANGDGLDEQWYPSLKLHTPGEGNDNAGLQEDAGQGQVIVHDPAKEISVLSRSLEGVGELAGLSSGEAWKPFSTLELAKIVDRFTVEGIRLETEGHLAGGGDAWRETPDGFAVSGQDADEVGSWSWAPIPEGLYRLTLYGAPGERLAVRWPNTDESVVPWNQVAPIFSDAQGRFMVGQIHIGEETPTNLLTLEVTCMSNNQVCHFNHAQLDPQLIRLGPVNVNTASVDVLLALPGMTSALVSRLLAGRPYGDQEGAGRGIGDLLLGEVLGADEETKLAVFRQVAHLLTIRSDMFRIKSVGEALQDARTTAIQHIETVVER